MIRAVFFDFYGVWLPNIFANYLAEARQHNVQAADTLESLVSQYFHGQIGIEAVADAFRFNLSRPDIETRQFLLSEQSISPAIIEFMRELHGHFLKIGVLANLGQQEYKLLSDFNAHNQLFETIGGPLPFGSNAPLISKEIFAQATQAIGEPPRSCLVVSGDPIYQNFADSLGMHVLAFEGFPKLRLELDKLLTSETA